MVLGWRWWRCVFRKCNCRLLDALMVGSGLCKVEERRDASGAGDPGHPGNVAICA